MSLTIADLKIGAKLVFGMYGVKNTPVPITWLKANSNCEFISEFVLDHIRFDDNESNSDVGHHRIAGNSDYGLSNILQFMNSCEDDWYSPSHPDDEPPGNYTSGYDRLGEYLHHSGFLSDFEDYEIESIIGGVNLPTVANIFGTNGEPRFPLFNRKGFRGRPTADMLAGRHINWLDQSSFCEFWLQDGGNTRYTTLVVGRDGSKFCHYVNNSCGMRPKCMINPSTEVEALPDGSFRILPFKATKCRGPQICTEEELLNLMGLL